MVKIYYILRQFDLIWTEWNHKLKAVLWNNFFYEKWKSIFWMEKYIFNLEALHMWTNSVKFSHSVVSDSLRAHEPQHTRPPCPSPTPGVYSHPCPSSRWSHPTISSSVITASGSFQMSQLFASGGQRTEVSASASVLPMNTQDWSSLGWTGWISLQPKGLSRVFSNTAVQKHQFFSAQLYLKSNSHIHTWPLEKS